jgi:hypothetical protein
VASTRSPRPRSARRGVVAVAVAAAAALPAGCGGEPKLDPVLDGARPVSPGPLAEISLRRAQLGGRWLVDNMRPNGAFHYWYRPDTDTYLDEDYNEVRHAGTTFSLFKLYGARRDARVLAGAERATRYIDRLSVRLPPHPGRAFVYNGKLKLGTQALALVALLERRRVTRDRSYDRLIADLAAFLREFEDRRSPGRLYSRYLLAEGRFSLTPPSDYYPGEALLALTRLAQQFPRDGYLADARRVADYLVHRKDGNIPAAGVVPREDHWLTLALSELYRLDRDPDYRTVAYLEADSMVRNQHRSRDEPALIGASGARNPPNYTSTATKGEAMAAAWDLARFSRDRRQADRLALATQRNVQFAMRVQYTADVTGEFPNPRRPIGAWPQDPEVSAVRMDFVQHNISQLIDAWHLMTAGAIPLARPLPGAGRLPRAVR